MLAAEDQQATRTSDEGLGRSGCRRPDERFAVVLCIRVRRGERQYSGTGRERQSQIFLSRRQLEEARFACTDHGTPGTPIHALAGDVRREPAREPGLDRACPGIPKLHRPPFTGAFRAADAAAARRAPGRGRPHRAAAVEETDDRFAGHGFELDDGGATVGDVAGDRRTGRQGDRQWLALADAGPAGLHPNALAVRQRGGERHGKSDRSERRRGALENRACGERLQQRGLCAVLGIAAEAARLGEIDDRRREARFDSRQRRELEAARQVGFAVVAQRAGEKRQLGRRRPPVERPDAQAEIAGARGERQSQARRRPRGRSELAPALAGGVRRSLRTADMFFERQAETLAGPRSDREDLGVRGPDERHQHGLLSQLVESARGLPRHGDRFDAALGQHAHLDRRPRPRAADRLDLQPVAPGRQALGDQEVPVARPIVRGGELLAERGAQRRAHVGIPERRQLDLGSRADREPELGRRGDGDGLAGDQVVGAHRDAVAQLVVAARGLGGELVLACRKLVVEAPARRHQPAVRERGTARQRTDLAHHLVGERDRHTGRRGQGEAPAIGCARRPLLRFEPEVAGFVLERQGMRPMAGALDRHSRAGCGHDGARGDRLRQDDQAIVARLEVDREIATGERYCDRPTVRVLEAQGKRAAQTPGDDGVATRLCHRQAVRHRPPRIDRRASRNARREGAGVFDRRPPDLETEMAGARAARLHRELIVAFAQIGAEREVAADAVLCLRQQIGARPRAQRARGGEEAGRFDAIQRRVIGGDEERASLAGRQVERLRSRGFETREVRQRGERRRRHLGQRRRGEL